MADIEDDAPPGVPEWVVTYGDMMSLLLTFFIMLVSMSELKEEGELRAMLDSISQNFGASVGAAGVPGRSMSTTSIYNKVRSSGSRSEGGTKAASRSSEGHSGAHQLVKRINQGTVVTLGGPALFRRFQATMTDEMAASLDTIAEVLAPMPNELIVRGHASREPLDPDCEFARDWQQEYNRLPDKLDLSFARAQLAADYLVSRGIPRERIRVSAVGDTEERVTTRDETVRRQNRRVDVFVIDSYLSRPATAETSDR